MNKALLLAFAMLPITAIAGDDKGAPATAEAKDTTKFCYANGKEYSKGYRLVDETKQVLVCSEERSWVSHPNQPPARLEWVVDTGKKMRAN